MRPSTAFVIAHRRVRWPFALAAAVLIAQLLPADARAAKKKDRSVLEGVVMDQANEPLDDVAVTVTGQPDVDATTTSNRRGEFSLDLVAGEFVVEMEKEGYAPFAQTVQLQAGQRLSVRVNLLDAATGRRNEAIVAYNAGATALRSGDRATARARFEAAIEADPTLVEPYGPLADIYLDEGSHAAAAATAEKLLELRPGDRDARIIAYEAYRELGDEAKVDELRALLAADPKLAPKLAVQAYNEGARALQGGDQRAAIASFEEALELDPELAAAHGALATVLYNRERYADAKATVDRLLELQPADVQGRRMRYLVHDALGELEAAAAAIEALIEVDAEGAAELLMKSAERSFKAGENDEARKALERLLELEPENARAHYTLGLVHVTGDPAAARRHLGRFLELAPDDPEAETARRLLAGLP